MQTLRSQNASVVVQSSTVSSACSSVSPVTEAEVQKLLSERVLKPSPLDFVPVQLLKLHKDLFSVCLARLANLSFSEGVFPELFRTGRITPIIKKRGLPSGDPANYRPITNLNSIGKLLERLMLERLKHIVYSSSNFSRCQSAYRAYHSTETALTRIVNDLRVAADGCKPSLLLALDISAAFDTINHELLLKRLSELFGISGTVLKWIETYLTDRTQFVHIQGRSSTLKRVTTGVPQGSVLGAFLFSVFTAPLGQLISDHQVKYHQYADDTQLYCQLDVPSDNCFNVVSSCAKAVINWHLNNGLMLNASKTEAIVIGTRQQVAKLRDNHAAGIKIDDSVIQLADNIRSLGVSLDESLSFKQHVADVARACNYHIRSLAHIRNLITESDAAAIGRALVLSKMDYCNVLLSGTSNYNINRLQCVQNSLARVVTRSPLRTPHEQLLKSLHWLPVRQRIDYKVISLTFKSRFTGQPEYLRELVANYVPPRSLRSTTSCNLSCPTAPRTEFARKAFSHTAPSMWNKLPNELKAQTAPRTFHKLLKTHLFNDAFN